MYSLFFFNRYNKLSMKDINNIIIFGFCNIFSNGIVYYRMNKINKHRICVKISTKICSLSVNRNIIKRFIKKKMSFNINNYDVVIILNQIYDLYKYEINFI